MIMNSTMSIESDIENNTASRMSLSTNHRLSTMVFGLLFLVTIGLLAGFFGVFLHSFPADCFRSPPRPVGSLRDKVCLDCGLFQTEYAVRAEDVDGLDELVFVDKLDVGTERLCCVDAVIGLWRLLDIFPGERQRVMTGAVHDCEPTGDGAQNKSSDQSGGTPLPKATAAHMFLDIDSLWDGVQGLEWTVGDGGAAGFLADVSYLPRGNDGGRLLIPKDGIYQVYSSFHFDSYYNRTLQRRSKSHAIVSHSIRRNSKSQSNEILQLNKIQVQADTLKESYISRNMKFNKGDEVFIYISDVSLIHSSQMFNVFGLFEV